MLRGKRPASRSLASPPSKYPRGESSITVGSSRNIIDARTKTPDQIRSNVANSSVDLKLEFINLLNNSKGISNSVIKKKFGEEKYKLLVPIINEMMKDARLTLNRLGDELVYTLVSDDVASKFSGLDMQARLVYQIIEKAGNVGIWTKDIRIQTSILQQALTKVFKALESRKLIKPIKSVTNKSKKLYMLYNLTPSKEITGGPWYTGHEFDYEFISELRNFVLMCLRRMNSGKGVSLLEIVEKMKLARVSRVELNLEEVQQLVQTLAYDHLIENSGASPTGAPLFIEARKVTSMSNFKFWDQVLCPHFHFRKIQFEDGVELSAHEPHHHTA